MMVSMPGGYYENLSAPAADVYVRILRAGLARIVLSIVESHGAELEAVLMGDRHKLATAARHHAWHVIKWSKPDLSYPDIGRMWNVDHTTVMDGIDKHEHQITAPDIPFKQWIAGVKKAAAEQRAALKAAS